MSPRLVILVGFAASTLIGYNFADSPIAITLDPEFAAARQPQVAVGVKGAVHITFGLQNAVFCATSADSGRTFRSPVKVGESGVLALGKGRGPRIAAISGAVIVTAI